MSGIGILLDLLRKNPSFQTSQSFHSSGFFSASAAASAAAASVAAGTPFAYRALFSSFRVPVAHCDAGAAFYEDYVSNLRSASEKFFQKGSLQYSTKEYKIELKPLFSAFEIKTLAITSLRSFILCYLPLLEPHSNLKGDDDEFLENHHEQHVDYVVPFKRSVKQIARETTVVTTRRILERLAVHYISQRMAWKLLKDVPKSATRKAQRGLPTTVFLVHVSRTTFRGHFLGVAASWIVQVGIEIFRFARRLTNSKEADNDVNNQEQAKLLGKKIAAATARCGASLIFASIGAGIGATIFRPSTGQWIGCTLGDLAGSIVVSICLESSFHMEF